MDKPLEPRGGAYVAIPSPVKGSKAFAGPNGIKVLSAIDVEPNGTTWQHVSASAPSGKVSDEALASVRDAFFPGLLDVEEYNPGAVKARHLWRQLRGAQWSDDYRDRDGIVR